MSHSSAKLSWLVTALKKNRKMRLKHWSSQILTVAAGHTNNTLKKTCSTPSRHWQKTSKGKVTIQFTVESSGQLSDFKVLKGIGHGCEEEVIRLVKQGPKWNPTRRNTESLRDKVKVRMKFTLPKK